MKQLNKPADNMGGLLKIWAVPPSDIVVGSDDVSISSTTNIVEIYCSPGSMSFTEQQNNPPAGTYYKSEVKAFAPKDSAEAKRIIDDMTGRKWIVIYLDQNEQYKVVGTALVQLHVAFDLDTGADTPDLNGHSVSFFADVDSKAIFINDPFAG